MTRNAIYAQSGGVTAVINASASGVIKACRESNLEINKLYAAHNGILGILHEEIFDTSYETQEDINLLTSTPGGAFGSCRYKLKGLQENEKEYQRLIEVFRAHNIHYFFYNGGNDSADTCLKVSQIATELGFPLQAIHIPKTIDNDLVITDNCPGFGSVAKYVAISTLEASMDLASMASSSTKVFILEVMGRHAGWIAASSALASTTSGTEPPHIILFPEISFDKEKFLAKVKEVVDKYGYCVIVASEGLKDQQGTFLSGSAGSVDSFGHAQLGGVASILASHIKKELGLKYHYAIADYLQRSARHIASLVDVEQAYKLGYMAVKYALQGHNGIMPYIKRVSNSPYEYEIEHAPLTQIANQEKFMPLDFITEDGFHVTNKCRDYLTPLIRGEDFPPFKDGIPNYVKLKNHLIEKKLAPFK